MMRAEKVSVVTVCRNAKSTIALTLQSVREQTYHSVEHVLIDGNSMDGTVEIVKRHNPSLFISEPDDGVYHAMQKGVRKSSGDILFFLNSGDRFYDKDVIRKTVEFFDLTGSDAVFGNLFPCYLNLGDSHDHKAFRDQKTVDLSYFNNRRLFYDESIHHQTIFYKRKIFNVCGYLCDDAGANGEYYLNLCAFVKHDFTIKYIPLTICRFALGGLSTSDFIEEWKRFTVAREILRHKFFPSGRILSLKNENEFLFYPPNLKSRLRSMLHRHSHSNMFIRLKDLIRQTHCR